MNNFMMACLLGIIAWGCPVDPIFAEQTFVVSSAAGNATDIVARQVAKRYGDNKVVNMPNAAGTQGVAEVVKNPDQILIAASSAIVAAPATIKNLRYDPEKDIKLVSPLAIIPMYMVSKRFTNMDTMLKHAEKNTLLFGATGYGSVSHLYGAKFGKENNIGITVVPYKGTNDALTDLLTERIDFAYMPLPQILEHPELHVLPVKFAFWVGAYVSAKMPEEKVKQVTEKMKSIALDKQFDVDLDKIGLSAITENMKFDIVKEIRAYKNIAESLDIQPK